MAKATKTIKQPLGYKSAQSCSVATTKTLFNQVAAFYFEVIVAHPGILELSSEEALTALETLTHTTKDHPHPVVPWACAIPADIAAMFRRAAIKVQTQLHTNAATRFIKGGKHLHGLRKRQLGRIARNRSKTGIIAIGEQDNAVLWAKIRALDVDSNSRLRSVARRSRATSSGCGVSLEGASS
jgi:hypothetical protein